MNFLNMFTVLLMSYIFLGTVSDGFGTFKTIHTGPKPIWNDTHVDRLKKDLLVNYDRFMRPEHDYNATELRISLTILNLETEERKCLIMVDSWMALEWTDSKLKWNEEDYGGLFVIRVADHEVWQPDIYLYNSAAGGEQLSRASNKNVLVYSGGKVLWVPSIRLTALCEFNLRYWPFDTQNCVLRLGSWTHNGEELSIRNSTDVSIDDTAVVSSWKINAYGELVEKKYSCCAERYQFLDFHLNITRKSIPYRAIVVTPAVVSSFLILTQFWLPPYVEEKMILNGFTVLLLNMFLLYFNHQIYGAGIHTPLLVLFYSSALYIAGFSTISSIITYLLCKVKKTKPLPARIKKMLCGNLSKWLLLIEHFDSSYPERKIEEVRHDCDNKHHAKKHILTNSIQEEWTTLAVCIDRLLFVMFTFIFIILAIRFS